MQIKLDEGARLPTRAHSTDAGLDLYSRESVTIYPGESHTFDTGVHIILGLHQYGKVESKSGLNINHGVVSCGGVIDEGYTGSIKVKLYNLSHEAYTFNVGDKIAQLIIMMYNTPVITIIDDPPKTERGINGFGSTGK